MWKINRISFSLCNSTTQQRRYSDFLWIDYSSNGQILNLKREQTRFSNKDFLFYTGLKPALAMGQISLSTNSLKSSGSPFPLVKPVGFFGICLTPKFLQQEDHVLRLHLKYFKSMYLERYFRLLKAVVWLNIFLIAPLLTKKCTSRYQTKLFL